MDINLKGKNALVCGGSGGIGKASAIVLAEMGANVTILARNEDTLFETLNQLDQSEGQKHEMIVADASQEDDFRGSLVVLTKKRPIHILVNNSGGPPAGNIVDATTDAFKAAFSQHLIANHIAVQVLLPGMKKEGYGRIINIISTSVKQPLRGLGVSNTIRAAVANWSKTLATELAPFGITVNNVLPGATETERLKSIVSTKANKTGMAVNEVQKEMLAEIPMGRFATAEEIANAVGFLASPAAAYITGTQITVDGGRTGVL
ncbi:MAG: SDR family oxidoreductase [Saprospiraceae bacterium]